MTESFKQQLQELVDLAAKDYTSTAYFELEYSTCGTTAQECQAAFKACGNFLMPVLMKAVEQRNQNAYGYPEDENKELLNILKGESK